MAAADLPQFDPRIIEHYVERTYRKATAIMLGSALAGVMIGAVFGALPLTSLGAGWPIPRMFGFATMLIGAFVGGVIGYTIGDTRAFVCRLQGQIALAQVSAAKNAAAALTAVRQMQALAAQRATTPAPEPAAPVPAPLPAPVPVTPPAPEPLAPAPVPVPTVAAVPPPVPAPVPELRTQVPAPVPAPAPQELRVAVAADLQLPPVTP